MVAPMALIPPHIASQQFAELIARPDVAAMLAQQGDSTSYSGSINNDELGHFASQVFSGQEQAFSGRENSSGMGRRL
jgi:hypothetical protein